MKRILFGLIYILFFPVIFIFCIYLEVNQIENYETIIGILIPFGFLFNIFLSFIDFSDED